MTAPGLPDATGIGGRVIDDLLAKAEGLAWRADGILAPIASNREAVRARLLAENCIVRIGEPQDVPVSVVAVDGGSVTERMYAADLLVAVAVSAEGMTGPSGLELGFSTWAEVDRHQGDLERLTGAAMAAQELKVLSGLEHDFRIFDGSHGVPVISLSSALFSKNPYVSEGAALICDEFGVVESLRHLCEIRPSGKGEIVALPKADSSREFAELYADTFGLEIGSGDRFLAAQVLEPGEMLYPRTASEYARLEFGGKFGEGAVAAVTAELNKALEPLREAAREDLLQVTYVKPEGSDTVVKVEFRDGDGLATARRIGRIISDETPGPHLQEPFAQHMADLAAKSVSAGARAVNSAMIGHLPETASAYLPYLARGYRT